MSIYDSFYERIAALTVQKIYDTYGDELGVDLLSQIISSDPTYQGTDQIGSYTPWLIKQFRSNQTQEDELPTISNVLDVFNRIKSNLQVRDIYQYPTIDSLFETVNPYLETHSLSQSEQKENNANILYDDGQWLLVQPLTFEAECLYGANTKWCTTSKSRGQQIFQDMTKNAPLFIIIDRKTGKKFQYDASSGSFHNELDNYDYQGFLALNPPKELMEYVIENFRIQAVEQNKEETAKAKIKEKLAPIITKIKEDYGIEDVSTLIDTLFTSIYDMLSQEFLALDEESKESLRSEYLSNLNPSKETLNKFREFLKQVPGLIQVVIARKVLQGYNTAIRNPSNNAFISDLNNSVQEYTSLQNNPSFEGSDNTISLIMSLFVDNIIISYFNKRNVNIIKDYLGIKTKQQVINAILDFIIQSLPDKFTRSDIFSLTSTSSELSNLFKIYQALGFAENYKIVLRSEEDAKEFINSMNLADVYLRYYTNSIMNSAIKRNIVKVAEGTSKLGVKERYYEKV